MQTRSLGFDVQYVSANLELERLQTGLSAIHIFAAEYLPRAESGPKLEARQRELAHSLLRAGGTSSVAKILLRSTIALANTSDYIQKTKDELKARVSFVHMSLDEVGILALSAL